MNLCLFQLFCLQIGFYAKCNVFYFLRFYIVYKQYILFFQRFSCPYFNNILATVFWYLKKCSSTMQCPNDKYFHPMMNICTGLFVIILYISYVYLSIYWCITCLQIFAVSPLDRVCVCVCVCKREWHSFQWNDKYHM